MHDRFINGEDADWVDYAQIDADETLDDIKQIQRDKEDQWFDKDDQEDTDQNNKTQNKVSEYTGVIDY